jgi:LmbE family N-acetylglucosaminyl deacetylase
MIRWMATNPAVRPRAALPDVSEFGLPELEITTVVDVRASMAAKRSAMAAHESQVGDLGPFVAMPGEQVEPPRLRPEVFPPSQGQSPLARHGHPIADDS